MDFSTRTGNYLCDRHKVYEGRYCASDAKFAVTAATNPSGLPGLGAKTDYATCAQHLAQVVRKVTELDKTPTVRVLP